MADVRITQYPLKSVISDDDIFLIADSNDVDVNGFLKYKKVKAKDLPSIVNTAENITYANLIGLMAANGLITSTFYRITDSTSGVSPLLVQAVGVNAISYQAFDGANPLNTINYNVATDTIRWNKNQTNPPQDYLSGSGIVKSTAGTISYLTDNSTNWNTAFNDSIVSAAVTGSATKTLTLNQQDGGTVTASWSDIDTGLTSVGLSMPSAFTVSNSPLTANGTLAVTGAGVASQYVRGDGTLASFPTSTGGGSSVSYYFNGGTSQGVIGGNTYYEMSETAVIGVGADFNINANGYIAQFVTDANDPSLLNIPAGNWNFEMWFSASSGGGSPSFYLELYKYDGATLTLISSGSAVPEGITGGTAIDLYTTALAVPSTALTITDRLAVRVFVNNSSRTITLHTQNGHLCQAITTFSTGLTALNGLTNQVQYLTTGTSGTDFAISSTTDTHTFNLPTASATNRGALSSANWSTFNAKQNAITLTTTGTSGAATLVGATLNIPNYGTALANYLPLAGGTLTGALIGTTAQFNKLGLGGVPITGLMQRMSGSINETYSDGATYGILNDVFLSTTPTVYRGFTSSPATLTGGTLAEVTHFRAAQGAFTGTPALQVGYQVSSLMNGATLNYGFQGLLNAATGRYNLYMSGTADNYMNGNLGLGVTPSAWYTTFGTKAIQFAASGSVYGLDVSSSDRRVGLMNNAFINSSGTYTYINTGHSTQYEQNAGKHTWSTAASGTAGNAITFTAGMTLDASGQLLIGTTTSSTFKLDVVGTARFTADATINGLTVGEGGGSIATNTAVGASALNANTTGDYNTALGSSALVSNISGANNTALGASALFGNVTGSANTAIGLNALRTNTASNNTAVGFEAAYTNASGTNITAIGYRALKASTGANNTAVGNSTLLVNSTGTNNTALGDRALTANTTGITNTAIGQAALFTNIVGNNNTAIGTSALFTSTGSANTAIGSSALLNNTASNNTAVGFEAALTNTSGLDITAFGYQALRLSTGNRNTAFGYQSGAGVSTGTNNCLFGASTAPSLTVGSSNIVFGYAALLRTTSASNNIAIGTSTLETNVTGAANVGIGHNALLFNTASNNTAVGFEAAYTNASGTDITAIGYRALKASTGVSNTAVGSQALTANTTGANNTAIGKSALIANTTGFSNTAIGESVLLANVGGTYNTAIGSAALSSNVSGSNNIAIGRLALQNNTANNNTAVGFEAANANTSGQYITAIGYQALRVSTGDQNTAVGWQSLLVNTTGAKNTAVGQGSLYSNTTGANNTALGVNALGLNTASNNTAVGFEAALTNTSGIEVTAIGHQALKASTGNANTAIGKSALTTNTTGAENTGIGSNVLFSNTTGQRNIAIGSNSMFGNTTGSNCTAIGWNQTSTNFSGVSMIGSSDIATGSNQMRFGSASINNGAVATETVVSDRTWAVFINGVAYKILLKA